MRKFIIKGPAELSGEISVKGSKNAALKILPASLLSNKKITIYNLPKIKDIKHSLALLKDLGAKIEFKDKVCQIQTPKIIKTELNQNIANKFRASIIFAGPILAMTGEVKFPHPGGCVIGAGARPIDLFLDGFTKFGAELEIKDNFYHLKAKKLKACDYFFTKISVTGTESLMMTAVLAQGTTTLRNCAIEPEISALADYLNKCGAKISGAGTSTIKIKGVKKISAGEFNIMPDRIETGTFAIMAVATNSQLRITNCQPNHIRVLLNIFNKIGVKYQLGDNWLKIEKNRPIKSYSIKTHEYPGFPTDLQSPYTVLMTQAIGQALIHETIYDRRLVYVDMLMQMGANITMCDPHRVLVNGPTKLFGRKLTSPDLRAGIAMLIAGLIAQGTTEIENIYQIERGYEEIDKRLKKIGANIKKIIK